MMARIVYGLYSIGANVAAAGASWWMRRKKRWNDESVAQRYGRQLLPSSGRRPIWIHAASMGEVRVGATIAKALAERGESILGTAMTETGYGLLKTAYPEGSVAARTPFDLTRAVSAFLDQYNPSALVLVETEWWPNMLIVAARRNVPVFVVNGRISDKAFPWYRRTAWFWRSVLSGVCYFHMRSAIDAERVLALGVDSSRVGVSGSLKTASVPPASEATRALVASIRTVESSVWVAGSTRPGEEEILLDAHRTLMNEFPNLQLWLAPRHPDRFESVGSVVTQRGFTLARWSRLKPHAPSAKPNVVLIDQMGILPELYGFADIAFVGGSLRPFGGHNPLEPALAGTPVIFGQHMESQRESAEWLLNEGCGSVVTDATTLADAVARELRNDMREADRERRVAAMKAHAKGTVDRVADDLLARIAACATTTIC